MEELVELLNHLHVTVENMDERGDWAKLLLDTLKTSEGARCLPYRYWELLANSKFLTHGCWGTSTYNPQIKRIFIEAQEWGKLEPSGFYGRQGPVTGWREDIERLMLLLFRQRLRVA